MQKNVGERTLNDVGYVAAEELKDASSGHSNCDGNVTET